MKVIPVKSKAGYLYAMVDDDRYEELSKYKWFLSWGSKSRHKYAFRNLQKDNLLVKTYMHRQVTNCPKNFVVDHIDFDGLNNCRGNLRIISRQNNMRRQLIAKHNTSGFKGVSWHKKAKKWSASISYKKQSYHLGLFTDITEAARAYDKKSKQLLGKYAEVNFK